MILRQRRKFIADHIHEAVLWDLAKGKIKAFQAGFVYDLLTFLSSAGTTYHRDLVQNRYYLDAVQKWVDYLKVRRERFRKARSL